MYYRGDTCLEISPFTNYYMLTIYRESNDSTVDDSVPLDLTNLGTVYLSFINGGDKIRIPNYTLAENVDMANGEVVFRIASEEAERILNFSNRTFYISTAIGNGDSSSDETVLYSGQWNDYASAMQTSLTDTITTLNGTITELNGRISDLTDSYELRISELENEIAAKQSEIDALNARVSELEERVASSNDYVEATIVNNDATSNKIAVSKDRFQVLQNIQISASALEQTDVKSYFSKKDLNTQKI